mmetsp:Transcript_43786/g.128972  ORF Transcript_43786/g.128972 Transcript_43786/m.128972 type:complete len:250 (+) Transcript_43786:768-1517(+)
MPAQRWLRRQRPMSASGSSTCECMSCRGRWWSGRTSGERSWRRRRTDVRRRRRRGARRASSERGCSSWSSRWHSRPSSPRTPATRMALRLRRRLWPCRGQLVVLRGGLLERRFAQAGSPRRTRGRPCMRPRCSARSTPPHTSPPPLGSPSAFPRRTAPAAASAASRPLALAPVARRSPRESAASSQSSRRKRLPGEGHVRTHTHLSCCGAAPLGVLTDDTHPPCALPGALPGTRVTHEPCLSLPKSPSS